MLTSSRHGVAIKRLAPFLLPIALLAGLCRAEPDRAAERPYDVMWRSFGAHLNPADPLAWAGKVRAIARDEYHFWRGTRDLYYAWAGEHCRDWLADPNAYAVCHGDLHLGNIGSYAAAGRFGAMACGEVDFDESARLPVQLELLQAVITCELIARDNGIDLSAAQKSELHAAIFDSYAGALANPSVDTGLAAMLKGRADRPYSEELQQFTHDGRFRRTIEKEGQVTDILHRLPDTRHAAVAAALAEAVQHDARLAGLLRPYDAADFNDRILDVAERTRIDSSGSQGLVKMLVLLRKPFRGQEMDGLIYLKQQVPSAAERAGIIPLVEGSPARRYVRDLDRLTHGQSLAASWCEMGGRSFWVSIKEPWSSEPSSKKIKTFDALLNTARVLSRVAADSHRDEAARLRPLLTELLRKTVTQRADEFLQQEAMAYADFCNDTRVTALIGTVTKP